MKKLLLTVALVALTTAASFAQGTISMINGPTLRARWKVAGTDVTTAVNIPVGTQISFGIFIGDSAASLGDAPVGSLATIGTTAGVLTDPTPLHGIPGHAPGTQVFAQVRAWDATFGSDWRAAQAQGRFYGQTDVRQLEPLGAEGGPATVIWQSATGTNPNRFNIIVVDIVPEPSTIALAVLGLGSLLLFRRRKA